MLRVSHKGGEKVSRGNYWNHSNGKRISLDSTGTLPGDGSVTYYRANPVLILAGLGLVLLFYAASLPCISSFVLTAVLGLLFTAFLPFIEVEPLYGLLYDVFLPFIA